MSANATHSWPNGAIVQPFQFRREPQKRGGRSRRRTLCNPPIKRERKRTFVEPSLLPTCPTSNNNREPWKREATLANKSIIPEVLEKHEEGILEHWIRTLKDGRGKTGRLREGELNLQARDVLKALRGAAQAGRLADVANDHFGALREVLTNISRSRALQSYTSSETASFVLSLKKPIFERVEKSISNPTALRDEVWILTELVDQLALYITDVFQRSREKVIERQQEELSELSTPVVELWRGILALPLIGTLDSNARKL